MRSLFIVGCRLLGIYFLYLAFTSFFSSIGFLVSIREDTISGISRTGMILNYASYIVPQIIFAIPLVFKAELVADMLKLRENNGDSQKSTEGGMLRQGITLLGVYFFCIAVGNIARTYVAVRKSNVTDAPIAATYPGGFPIAMDFLWPVLTLIISLFMIFGAKKIAAFLERDKTLELTE